MPTPLRALMQGPLPVTAPLVLNPLMARMVEAAGFPAGYLGGGATGYQKVALEANLNLTEMCQAALDIGAVSRLPLILDGACGYGDPMHMHRTIGMSEAAGFAAIEIEDQLVPKRAHHHIGIEHMIPRGADGGQGGDRGGGAAQPGLPHHRAHQRGARQHDGRRAPPRGGLSQGGRRRAAALDGAHARAAARSSASGSAARSCTWRGAAASPAPA